jgi:SOS-response transcriptional repressor LexA
MIFYNKPIDDLSKELLKLIKNNSLEWMSMKEIQDETWIDHPQKIYNRLEKLIKDWYITEDYEVLKMPDENKIFLPFYWWAQCWHDWAKIFEEYPRDRIEIDLDKNNLKNKNYKSYFITRAKWKSMEPTIKTWEDLLIEFNPEFISEWYKYLIKHNDKAKIKKIKKINNKVFLHSLNPDYPDLEVKEEDDFDIIWIVKIIWVKI